MYRLAQQATAQAQQLVEIARDRLDLGQFNALAFRDAQLALQRAQVQEVVALQAGWSAFYELERLRGALRVGIEPVP
jgi:outer membrane protein TolC